MWNPVGPLGWPMTPQDNRIHTGEESWWQDPYANLAAVRENHRTGLTSEGVKAILRWEDAEDLLKGDRFEAVLPLEGV